jgi:uncharacterized RDD family membrane protein YckC
MDPFPAEASDLREPAWGGFFRRSGALLIDIVVLFLFFIALFYSLYVCYRTGLAAHRRGFSLDELRFLIEFFFFVCFIFLGGYFTLLHRMGGQTIGKRVMRLRVVGAEGRAITSRQSVVRALGYLASAFFGLGFLWVLWGREKRAWHDRLAGTWVVRDRPAAALSKH